MWNKCALILICSVLSWSIWSGVGCTPNKVIPDGSTTTDASPNETAGDGANATCVPSKSAWNNHAKALIANRCNQCHGEKVNYGAPYSLTSYDELLKGEIGKRKVDRIAARMLAKTMPPIGTPQLPHNELDTLVEWATCGQKHADHSIGFTSTANVFRAPKDPPKGNDVKTFDMLANKFAVGEKILDLYQCFSFDAPKGADRFIKRIETIVDESRVLHHVVLLRITDKNVPLEKVFKCRGTPSATQYMYAWAPGGGAVEFSDGGVRMKEGDRFVVQIHYNNGAGVKDAVDSSGIRLHHAPVKGTEYGMLVPGPHTFSVAPGETKSVSSYCTMSKDTRILANMPHMHEIGSEFNQMIKRKDGKEELLIQLTGWNFEFQNFYEHNVKLKEGDKIVTTCQFKNTTSDKVTQGSGTKDEMCFAFMYVTPPPTGTGYCNELGEQIEYKPGKCAPDGADKLFTPIATGKFTLDKPAELKGGEMPKSKWVAKQTSIHLNTDTYGTIQLDLKRSYLVSKGVLDTTTDVFQFDVSSRLALRGTDSLSFDTDSQTSLSGKLTADPKAGTFTLEKVCGDTDGSEYSYQINNNGTLTILVKPKSKSGLLKIIDAIEFVFEKVD